MNHIAVDLPAVSALQGERHRARALILISAAIYLAFTFVTPVRVMNWGAMVLSNSIFTAPSVRAWANCIELSAGGLRTFPISPTMIGTSAKLLIKAPAEPDSCSQNATWLDRAAKTRHSFDAPLSMFVALIFPLLFLTGNPRKTVLLVAAVAPFLFDAATSRIWFDQALIFPGQHVYVAKTLATQGIYGWTTDQMMAYGLPAEAAKQWSPSGGAIPTGWTYPGYTLILAAIYWPLSFLHLSDNSLAVIAVIVNVAMVASCLALLYRIAGAIPVYLACLSGWAWSLCPFAASEPMQALLLVLSVFAYIECIAGRWSFVTSTLVLFACAGIGQITKPALGLFPPLFIVIALFWKFRAAPRTPVLLLGFFIAAVPTLLLGFRNYLTFGVWIFQSTVGGLFLAQGLDIGMTLPTYFGSNEIAYGAGSAADISFKFNALLTDAVYRHDLLLQKFALFIASLTGINYVAEIGRMGSDGYSGACLLLVGISVAYFARLKKLDPLDFAMFFSIAATAVLLFITQPLGRYFVPISFLYPIIVGRATLCGSLTTMLCGTGIAIVLWLTLLLFGW